MNSTKQSDGRTAPSDPESLVNKVRQRYGRIAEGIEAGCRSVVPQGTSAERSTAEKIGYGSRELEAVPDGANLGLGCGAPITRLDLQPGEVVLDLGSGGGLDAFLAATKVGPAGRVIGVDMTPQMIERARANAEQAGLEQVEFRQGRLEELPVEDDSVDAVTSNCVINLVPDKQKVFREIHRVLKPGGRLVVSDIVLDGRLPRAVETDLMAYVGCLSGAMLRATYFATIDEVGLGGIRILSDVDFLETVDAETPEELTELMRRTGVSPGDLKGKVRAVTFRAEKR